MLSSGLVGDEAKEIVLDTETTGLDCQGRHRVVEIGCVELRDAALTGLVWHSHFIILSALCRPRHSATN